MNPLRKIKKKQKINFIENDSSDLLMDTLRDISDFFVNIYEEINIMNYFLILILINLVFIYIL
jgi:hypothetical protein